MAGPSRLGAVGWRDDAGVDDGVEGVVWVEVDIEPRREVVDVGENVVLVRYDYELRTASTTATPKPSPSTTDW